MLKAQNLQVGNQYSGDIISTSLFLSDVESRRAWRVPSIPAFRMF